MRAFPLVLVLLACGPKAELSLSADSKVGIADGVDSIAVTATVSPAGQTVSWSASEGGKVTQTSNPLVVNVTSTKAGAITVTATTAGANDVSVDVTFSAATSGLKFNTQPANTLANNLIRPIPEVLIVDSVGEIITGADTQITVQIDPASCSAMLDANSLATVKSSSGRAQFNGLKVATMAMGCKLKATATDLTPALSDSFDIR